MKEITILGSTGSIGTQALEVIATNPDTLHVRVLAARHRAHGPTNTSFSAGFCRPDG